MKSIFKVLCIISALLFVAALLWAALPTVPTGTWLSSTSLGSARANASAAMLSDGRILITGGDAGSGALASAELFGTGGSVSAAAPMNVARSSHFSVTLQDGRVLVGGGTGIGGGATNAAEIYDPAADAWTQIGPMTHARSGATAALLQDGRVLIAGGDSSGTPSNTTEIFDPSANSFSFAGTMSAARTKHAMAVLQDGRVLIIGGFDGSNTLASSDIFDPASGNINPGPNLATARYSHSATMMLNGQVVVIGGAGNDGSGGTTDLASIEIFDASTGAFKPAGTSLTTARQGHDAFLLSKNNSVLIFGGTSGGSPVAAAELFVPQISAANGAWTYAVAATGANVTPRSAATGMSLQHDGLLWTAGGKDASGTSLASTELYGFATVKTDQPDYAPGSVVTITGSGWQPGETVTLTLVESPLIDTPPQMTAVADGNGNISNNQFSPDAYDVNVRFYLTAVGSQSGVQAMNTFTDAAKDPLNIDGGPYVHSLHPGDPIPGGDTFSFSIDNKSGSTTFPVSMSFTFSGPFGSVNPTSGSITGYTPATLSTTVSGTVPCNQAPGSVTLNVVGTLTSSTATITPDHRSGSINITVVNPSNANCTTTLILNSVNPSSVLLGSSAPVTFTAALTQASTSSGIPGKTIGFTVDGAFAGTATTNASGIAVFGTYNPSALAGGNHNVQATYAGDASFSSSTSNSQTLSVVTDNSAPKVTVSFSSPDGQNNWYVHSLASGSVIADDSTTGGSNVTAITCTGATVGSITGLNTVSASASLSVSAEGVNNISCQATDSAGNTGAGGASNNTATVKIDTQPPTGVSGAADRSADHNGWYTGPVTITFSGTDSTSGIASCTSTNYNGPDSATASVTGHCTDNAGNTSPDTTFNFKFDSTAPTAVALSVTAGTPGANGWYTSDVTVHTSGTESVSTPLTCTADQFQNTETAGQVFNGSCTNDAGLTTSAVALTVKLDKTGPTAALAVTAGTPGNGGWYISDVTVHASGSDSISNPVTCTADQFLTSDSNGHVFSGSCTNDAGLSTNAADLNVKLDKTSPTVNITPDRAADHNGWYNHVLTFTNPGTDSTSGIASCSTPAAYSGPDSMTASVTATCTDNAGNTSSGSFSFQFDSTPPANVHGAPNRQPDHNGWYNHAVDIAFTGNDSTSGIESCSTITYGGPDTTSPSVMGSCTDKAGNSSAQVASSSFKFDSTPPSATIAVTAGTLGTHGWYTSDVTVSTSGNDTVSNPTTCSADQFLSAETTGAIFNGSCTNDAGLTAAATPLTVKLDKTAPTGVTLTPSGTLGLNNWYTSDVTIHTFGNETISTPIVCTADQSQTSDTTGKVFHGSCTNDAGLSASAPDITIKRDATPPVLLLTFSPDSPDGLNNWWKSPNGVPFAWTCTDATSGIDATYSGGCPTPLSGTVAANGTTHFTGQVRDQAGNLSIQVVRDVRLDNIAPVVTWNAAGDTCSLPGNAGWCRAIQTAAFTASDATSGLANPTQASFTQSTGTNGTAVLIASGAVMDQAGNVNLGVNAGPYKIDSVAPTITINNPASGGDYLLNASIPANYSCSDATSGVATCAGPVATGTNFSTNPVGQHGFTVNATDVAGNPAVPVTYNYNILYASGGLCDGSPGHTILQPINADGSSVWKQGSTVPAKFRICDANGVSIGTAGVVSNFAVISITAGTLSTVDETTITSTNSLGWNFDPTAQQWIYNIGTKTGAVSTPNATYGLQITLNDGSTILFQFGLR